MPHLDPRIDAYVAKSRPFAQPILKHLRQLVHKASPEIVETVKWSSPHFVYRDANLCGMAAFKEHCAFGFWHQEMEAKLAQGVGKTEDAMGHLGRITSLRSLPSDKVMLRYLKEAIALIESGKPARPRPVTAEKKELVVPADLASALKKNSAAAKTFAGFSYSHRKEYLEWITEAKRPETREKRLETTLEWLAEGKSRNWKYQNC